MTGCRSSRLTPPGPDAKRFPKAWYRRIGGAATSTGVHALGMTESARSIALPTEPTCGEESSVEHIL